MRVRELMEKLAQQNPDSEVIMWVDHTEEWIEKVEPQMRPDGCPCCPEVEKVVLS